MAGFFRQSKFDSVLLPHESEGTKTQAGNLAFSVTFECYGEDVTATKVPFVPVLCDGS